MAPADGSLWTGQRHSKQSDNVILALGLTQSSQFQQLFYQKENGNLVLIVAKIVDDLKAAAEGDLMKHFLQEFDKRFKFGDVIRGPERLRFFGVNTIQDGDFIIETDGDGKLNAVTEYLISRQRRKQLEQALNEIEKFVFASVNSSLG